MVTQPRKKFEISRRTAAFPGIRELLQYRDLFLVLAYRDLRVRYAQTVLGLAWAILQPLVTLSIFILIFSRGLKVETGSIPYSLYALTGMSAWSYFSYVMNQSGQSIIGAQEMIKKIYFPRLVIPLSKALVAFVEFGVTMALLVLLFCYYGLLPSGNLVLFPFVIALNVIASVSVGIWLSALSIRYRDFIHVIPFLTQVGLYVTPIAYPATLIPEKYLHLYYLNPLAGIVEMFRWCILGIGPVPSQAWISVFFVLILFISGILYFKKMERVVADLI